MTKRHNAESVQSLKTEVCQLRLEINGVKRKPVSNCVADLLRFVQDNQRSDPLLGAVPDKMNPFRPKTSLQCLGYKLLSRAVNKKANVYFPKLVSLFVVCLCCFFLFFHN